MPQFKDKDGTEWSSGITEGLSEPLLSLIGRVIIAWSHLEQQFDMMYLSKIVMEGAGHGSLSTPRMKMMFNKFHSRCGDLKKYFRSLDISEEEKDKISNLFGKIYECKKLRDSICHSPLHMAIIEAPEGEISIDSSTAKGMSINWRNPHEQKFADFSESELQRLLERILRLYSAMIHLSLGQPLNFQIEPTA